MHTQTQFLPVYRVQSQLFFQGNLESASMIFIAYESQHRLYTTLFFLR